MDAGTTLTYGITNGTGGSTIVSGTTYDVSKAGTYGTLYLASANGAYVYVPNTTAINALTANAVETFTVSASDGLLSDPRTLTINLTGVNDIPIVTAAPTVTGTAKVGNALSTTDGTWTDADNNTLTYTYQWYRATDAAGTGAAVITGHLGGLYADHVRRAKSRQGRRHRQRHQRSSTRRRSPPTPPSPTPTRPTASLRRSPAPRRSGSADHHHRHLGRYRRDTLTYTYQWYRATDAAGTKPPRSAARIGQLHADTSTRTSSSRSWSPPTTPMEARPKPPRPLTRRSPTLTRQTASFRRSPELPPSAMR